MVIMTASKISSRCKSLPKRRPDIQPFSNELLVAERMPKQRKAGRTADRQRPEGFVKIGPTAALLVGRVPLHFRSCHSTLLCNCPLLSAPSREETISQQPLARFLPKLLMLTRARLSSELRKMDEMLPLGRSNLRGRLEDNILADRDASNNHEG
jgi:hypothetical protein